MMGRRASGGGVIAPVSLTFPIVLARYARGALFGGRPRSPAADRPRFERPWVADGGQTRIGGSSSARRVSRLWRSGGAVAESRIGRAVVVCDPRSLKTTDPRERGTIHENPVLAGAGHHFHWLNSFAESGSSCLEVPR